MALRPRVAVAAGVFLLLGGVVVFGRWYELNHSRPSQTAEKQAVVHVTNASDRGPGTLREALFIAAAASGPVNISIDVPQIEVQSALPALVNGRGVKIGAAVKTRIEASALAGGAVLDVSGPDTTLEGLTITDCPGASVLVRATRFRLTSSNISACDVGVDVAENASQTLLEGNRFSKNRIGVRFAASGHSTSVTNNEFTDQKDAGLWAVRGAADSHDEPIAIHDNKFTENGIGIVSGNIPVLVERNDFINAHEADIHVVGEGAVIRGNHINGGAAMGIVAENARGAIIENNELEGLSAYGVMVRGSSNTLVRANRLHNCGYGLAFVLGDTHSASTAADNTIIEPKFNGIDVVGDSPILRRNQVLRPRAYALHVEDFQPPAGGQKVHSEPFLDNNSFDKSGAGVSVTAASAPQRR